MKLFKVLAFMAVISITTISCSSDDNSIIRTEVKDQQLTGKNLTQVKGTYNYFHSANPIPIEFTEKQITIKMGDMLGSDQDHDIYDIRNVYKNTTTNVIKIVAHSKTENLFKAFFITNINENTFKFNMDNNYNFPTEEEAINTSYPDPTAVISVDHVKGIFGWLNLEANTVVKIALPISGKYAFSITMGGTTHSYSYSFTNEKVNFSDKYDMIVLAHNTTTNKILMVGEGENENIYYVAQLKDITEDTVKIARTTFGEKTKDLNKQEAEKEFAAQQELTASFTEYLKDAPSKTFELPITGKYEFAQQGMAYTYDIKNNIINFNNSYDMKVLDFNKEMNNILLQGIGEEKKNEFYVMKLRKITDNSVDIKRTTFKSEDLKNNEKEAKALMTMPDPENETGFFTYTKK